MHFDLRAARAAGRLSRRLARNAGQYVLVIERAATPTLLRRERSTSSDRRAGVLRRYGYGLEVRYRLGMLEHEELLLDSVTRRVGLPTSEHASLGATIGQIENGPVWFRESALERLDQVIQPPANPFIPFPRPAGRMLEIAVGDQAVAQCLARCAQHHNGWLNGLFRMDELLNGRLVGA